MGKNIDLKQKFDEYFNELEGYGMRSERFYEDCGSPELAKQMTAWLEAAFLQGARIMAQDTLDALGDYGTAVAGINEKCYNRTEAFDASHNNLMTYYAQVLKYDEEEE